jgi:hypothetical protein
MKLEVWYSKTLTITEMDKILGNVYPETNEIFTTINLENCAALTITPINGKMFMLLNFDSTVADIHHESIHIATHIFDYIGQPHTMDSDEFFAYTSTSIFEDILKLIKNKFKVNLKLLVE